MNNNDPSLSRRRKFSIGEVHDLYLGVKAFFPNPSLLDGDSTRAFAGHGGSAASNRKRVPPASPANTIIGRFQKLKLLHHPNLCSYIDIIKARHERLFVISEHYLDSLLSALRKTETMIHRAMPSNRASEKRASPLLHNSIVMAESVVKTFAQVILSSLEYLHQRGIVHRCLHLGNVLMDSKGTIRLSDYGIHYISGGGRHAPFCVLAPTHCAPEIIAIGPDDDTEVFGDIPTTESIDDALALQRTVGLRGERSDVWSVGVMLLQLMRGYHVLISALECQLRGDERLFSLAQVATENSCSELRLRDTLMKDASFLLLCGLRLAGQRVLKEAYDRATKLASTLKEDTSNPNDNNNNNNSTSDLISFDDFEDISDKKTPERHETSYAKHVKLTIEERNVLLLDALFNDMPKDAAVYSDSLINVCRLCLRPDPAARPSASDILKHAYFASSSSDEHNKSYSLWPTLKCKQTTHRHDGERLHQSDMVLSAADVDLNDRQVAFAELEQHEAWSLQEIFYLWRLAGGNVEHELANELKMRPAILRVPKIVRFFTGTHHALGSGGGGHNAVTTSSSSSLLASSTLQDDDRRAHYAVVNNQLLFYRNEADESMSYDARIYPLSLEKFRQRLRLRDAEMINSGASSDMSDTDTRNIPASGLAPIVKLTDPIVSNGAKRLERQYRALMTAYIGKNNALPSVALREKDIDYQRIRIRIFRELARWHDRYPRQIRRAIVHQAHVDVPPIVRGEVWCALLHVRADAAQIEYEAIDNEAVTETDHQLDLDIPRCHQYHPLLSSPEGRRSFKRILKAWVASQTELVYWQGLDSVLAPFVALHFNNEAVAYKCLSVFVDKYLHDYYPPDNTAFLQSNLLLYQQLLAYCDPQLAMHLTRLQFLPDLYAIPWFLTMFTHIFPLDRVYPIWDVIMVSPQGLAHFVAVSIMVQMRETLLTLDFNSCILLFSNLPSIDIHKCVQEARRMHSTTPMSLSASPFASNQQTSGDEARFWEIAPNMNELRKEMAPRMSVQDLIGLWQADAITVVDVRSKEAYQTCHLPRSFHFNTRKLDEEAVARLDTAKGSPLLVLGSAASSEARQFANKLVDMGFAYVVTLHGGFEVLLADVRHLLEHHAVKSAKAEQ